VTLKHRDTKSQRVRLKSSVAAVMLTTAKIDRYIRSNEIASNPVFLSIRLFNACTTYVNGSTLAIICIQPGKACWGYTAPLGKNSRVFKRPNIARGVSGSETRTISRNIMQTIASEETTITVNTRINLIGSRGFGMPAMNDPTRMTTDPAMTAFIVPDRLNP